MGKVLLKIIDFESGYPEFATGFAIIPLIHFVSDNLKWKVFILEKRRKSLLDYCNYCFIKR
jgi:hypothetical protein